MLIFILFSQIEGKRDEFRKYLEATGATEKLTTALMKLYQEPERPADAIGFIRKSLSDGVEEESEMVKEMKRKIDELTAEKQKADLELTMVQSNVKKTTSEIDSVLQTKFKALEKNETGTSLLKEYLTEEVFEKLKGLKTELLGTLLDNIQCGLTHFDSEIGIFSSDQFAYETFDLLFDPVLEDLHNSEVEGDDTEQVTQPDVDWGSVEEIEDLDPEGLFIKSISVTVGRSLNGVQFMPTIKLEGLQEVSEKIRKILMTITDEEFAGKYHGLTDIDDEQKKKWIEEGILFPEPEDKFLKAAETYRFWPLGRGLFLNDKNNVRVWINEQEHLQVTTFGINGNLREVYERLMKVMEFFESLEFARDKRWGFVGHNLKNIGSTMRITVKVKIPQLSLEDNAEKLTTVTEGFTVKNLEQGMFLLTNTKCFGISEFNTALEFQKAIKELIVAEKCLYK